MSEVQECFLLIEILLSSLYVDEESLTKDQVILPRDFLSFKLQQHIKTAGKDNHMKRMVD